MTADLSRDVLLAAICMAILGTATGAIILLIIGLIFSVVAFVLAGRVDV